MSAFEELDTEMIRHFIFHAREIERNQGEKRHQLRDLTHQVTRELDIDNDYNLPNLCQPKLQPKNSSNPLSDWRTKKMTSFILLLAQSTNIYTNYFVNYVSKILHEE